MTTSQHEHCYVAMFNGEPGAYALCGDLPEYADITAKFLADEIKRGATVQRVHRDTASALLKNWLDWSDTVEGKEVIRKRRRK